MAAGLVTLVVLLGTEPWLSMVWDEGYVLGRENRLRDWFSAVIDPSETASTWSPPVPALVQEDGQERPTRNRLDTRAELFDSQTLNWFWPFAREEPHGHPPFYALVGLIGDLVTPWREQLSRARTGPMLLASLAGGAIGLFLSRRYGLWPAVAAVGAWILQPRLFAHLHYAGYDAILTSLWILATLTFLKAVEPVDPGRRPRAPEPGKSDSYEPARSVRIGWSILLGLLCGMLAATKLTGWLTPLPMLIWTVLAWSRRGFLTLLIGGCVGAVTLYGLIPTWWADPIDGVQRFLESNLSRAETIPIAVEFLGTIYNTPVESLPWYNTLAWTVLVTPVGFLLLGVIGLGRSAWLLRREPLGALITLGWIGLMVLRALPNVPGHDGVRQFITAFGLLAILVGLGAATSIQAWSRGGRTLVALALLEGIVSVAVMIPVPLSYYSPAVGGLPGATRLGMEPTYYWDALDAETLAWLNRNTTEAQSVLFATFPTTWLHLQATGQLQANLYPISQKPPAWYVLQNRPGSFREVDRKLVETYQPRYARSKLGVPLVLVYSIQDYFQAQQASSTLKPKGSP